MKKIRLKDQMKYIKEKREEEGVLFERRRQDHTPSKRNSDSFSDSHIVILEANASTIAKKSEKVF